MIEILAAAELRAAETVITTAPTTAAGVQALKDHLSDVGRYTICQSFIPDFITPGVVEGFISGRAAAIS